MAVTAADPRDAEIAGLRATVAELQGVVADLRRQIETQQARIDRLVKLAFGRRAERVEGPTLSDAPPPAPPDPPPTPSRDTPPSPATRRGHGRRPTSRGSG